jgi:hypothetical protein
MRLHDVLTQEKHMAKAQINKQDTLGTSSADREELEQPAPSTSSPQERVALHEAAIHAPSHPVAVADPEHRAHTESIPATRVGELPGPCGTAEIHGNTHGMVFRDGDPDPEGWYSGQGGITGGRERDTVPVSEDAREAKRERHEPLAGND